MPTEQLPLLRRRVLVTRPAHQSETLCRLIEETGGIPVRLPALLIAPPADPARARGQLRQLAGYEAAVFISRNAVEQALELLQSAALPPIRLLAVGRATADALRERGYPVLAPEQDFNSEGLLALPELQNVAGKRIAIIRGTGGRELLADTLRERGAAVECIETYRRRPPPAATVAELREILRYEASDRVMASQETPEIQGPDIVIATSTQILENLLEMSGDLSGRLIRRPLVVLSARTRDTALAAGFTRVYIAPRNDDAGIVAALMQAGAENL